MRPPNSDTGSGHPDFVSAKTTAGPVPARHPALRAALVQASLDPATRSISHVATADVGSAPVEVDAVVVVRDDGPFVLDVVPARPVLKFDKTLLRGIALRGLGLALLVVTSEDLAAEPLDATAGAIQRGLAMFANELMDVVLMDLQYVPAVLTPKMEERAHRMVALIEAAASRAGFPVNVFHRFALMKQWHEAERTSFDRMVDPTDPDRLHHSDWSARRMAEALANTIAIAATVGS
ncbi:hypothetical protein [Bradyrhizobium sp. RT4b]|uniref:hypothetical protein n=1 Tax=Bradyrhizobium sp. RT4b TaxID=3156379 RepID=UPI003395504A